MIAPRKSRAAKKQADKEEASGRVPVDLEDDFSVVDPMDPEELRMQLGEGARSAMRGVLTSSRGWEEPD